MKLKIFSRFVSRKEIALQFITELQNERIVEFLCEVYCNLLRVGTTLKEGLLVRFSFNEQNVYVLLIASKSAFAVEYGC